MVKEKKTVAEVQAMIQERTDSTGGWTVRFSVAKGGQWVCTLSGNSFNQAAMDRMKAAEFELQGLYEVV